MGRNNRARREAKKRKKRVKAQARGPHPDQQSPWSIAIDSEGHTYDIESPFEVIYYDDEPDFMSVCSECGEVAGIPMRSLVMKGGTAEEYRGGPTDMGHVCPQCGHQVPTPPRIETGPDGRTLYTTDRRTLLDAGIEEWSPEMLTMTLVKDGVEFQMSVSSGSREVLVVCDDCGLPFATRMADQTLTSAADEPVEVEMVAGPCVHCGGMGKMLTHRVASGDYVSVTTSPAFAENVFATLAEDLRAGRIELGAVQDELRKHGGIYRALGDWLEYNPMNAVVVSTVLSTFAGLGIAQVPAIVSQEGKQSQQDQVRSEKEQPPATLTEDQVTEIVTKILEHYERTHRPDDGDLVRKGRKEQPTETESETRRNP